MTVYADTPLTREVLRTVEEAFGVRAPLAAAQRLYGGEESAAYRLGDDVAVLDWDEAYLGPPQREAAHAAWEWGDCINRGDLTGAYEFLEHYARPAGRRATWTTSRYGS